jgi:carbonic anhydrase/acetyltransferase-like protein (isoleucine patch superfamily)
MERFAAGGIRLPMNLLSYLGVRPQLESAPRHFGTNAVVIGRARIGADAWLAESSTIRADGHEVRAGRDLMLGPRATVHIAHELYPSLLGDGVTIGEFAMIHACTIGDGCVIEDGAVILDGSVVEPGSIVEAGAVVFPRTRLAGGYAYNGRPAKTQTPLRPGELQTRRAALRAKIGGQTPAFRPAAGFDLSAIDPAAFVANTATLAGSVVAAPRTSIWYGCQLNAADGEILIGDRSNVQDNSLLRCRTGGRIVIGADSTIGHNVTLADCTIGDRSLIGIGAVVAPGTVVEDDVFLAAGATTTPGQVLTRGKLWGGQPARALAPLDENKRKLIADTIPTYCAYADELARVQKAAATR